MEYRPLGRTGVQVSQLCLGTMMFGAWGNTDHDDSIRIIHRALDAGINFIDTADVYSAGESEEIVGKALKGRRDDVVLATKVSVPMDDDPNHRGNSRRWIVEEVENSLRRLGTDWIDLYQIHRPDPNTDIDETLGALTDLVHQGKVRYIGSSVFLRRADRRGTVDRPRPATSSASAPSSRPTRCSSAGSSSTSPTASATGWASSPTARSPAAGSREPGPRQLPDLARPPAPGRALRHVAARESAQARSRPQLAEVADDAGVSLIELAIAFVVNHPAVTSAIIGPRTMEQLDSQLPAADVALDSAVLTASTTIVSPA